MKIIKRKDKFYQVIKIEQEIDENFLLDQLNNIENIISNNQANKDLIDAQKMYKQTLSRIKSTSLLNSIKNKLNI